MPAFVRAYPPAVPAPGPAFWLPFRAGELIVQDHATPADGHDLALLSGRAELLACLPPDDPLFLGTLDGTPCLACDVPADTPLPQGWRAVSLRALYGRVPEALWNLAGYASQMLHWRATSRFCPVCGQQTGAKAGDWGRHCPRCGHDRYPLVTPAVLVLIHDTERLLLAHKPGWSAMYSILAGFVEPGESLEECVHREVEEEVGLQVTDLTYVGSQTWPFPHQLMVGFFARYAAGDIRLDEAELDDARWFTVPELPPLPSPVSLSRQMIDRWTAQRLPRS